MKNEEIIRKAESFAIEAMRKLDGSHDWQHVLRVRNYATYINEKEGIADPFILDLAAILHDTADSKFSSGKDAYSRISDFLGSCGLQEVSDKVISIIRNCSFSYRGNEACVYPELQILQDADRLDAIGAIGIARAFSYGGFRNNVIYEPENQGTPHSTINHFHEKLIRLRDLMNTKTGRRLAEERHNFMQMFLNQFLEEWNFKIDKT